MPIIKKNTKKTSKPVAKATKTKKSPKSAERAPRMHLGSLELMVLLAVSRLKDKAYGASIVGAIKANAKVETKIGAVYTSLSRMIEKKLIRSKMGEATSVRGGRAKKYYALTAAGEKAMEKSVQAIKKLAA
jgi:PadR family transcriptional regulator, regulatory protein PadR